MHSGWRLITELGLGVLRAHGADAGRFLQGQLSNDTATVRHGQLQLSGYHTPQGRAIALLRLTRLADDLLAILPLELVPVVVARLSRFVLRAKVRITDDSAQWQILGLRGEPPPLPGTALSLPYGSSRHLLLVPQLEPAALQRADTGTREDWVASDIAEGLPQVYLPSSEAFVAQMLNLDVTGGIALDKGCYTGQEIIARAHYRGQVKRRMHRFVSQLPCGLTAGESGVLSDGRGFKVVEAATVDDGHCEFLAVVNPAPGADAAETPSEPAETGAGTRTLLAARQLELPYELPGPRTGSGP
jgi:folate-binding protein YgfZ